MPKAVAEILGTSTMGQVPQGEPVPLSGPPVAQGPKSVAQIMSPSVDIPEPYIEDVRQRKLREITRDPRWQAGPETQQIERDIAKEFAFNELEESPQRLEQIMRRQEPRKQPVRPGALAKLGKSSLRLITEALPKGIELAGKIFPEQEILPGRSAEIAQSLVAGIPGVGPALAAIPGVGQAALAARPGKAEGITYRDVGEMATQAVDIASYMAPGVGGLRLGADFADLGLGFLKKWIPGIPLEEKPETAQAIKEAPITTALGLPAQIAAFKHGPAALRALGLMKLAKRAPAIIAGIPAIKAASEAAWDAHMEGKDPIKAALKVGVPRSVGFYLGGKIAKFHAENPAKVAQKNRLIFLDQITGGATPTPEDVRNAFTLEGAERLGVPGTRGRMLGEARVQRDIPIQRARAKAAAPRGPRIEAGRLVERAFGKGAHPSLKLLTGRLAGLRGELKRTTQPGKIQRQIDLTQQRIRGIQAAPRLQREAARSKAVVEAGRGAEALATPRKPPVTKAPPPVQPGKLAKPPIKVVAGKIPKLPIVTVARGIGDKAAVQKVIGELGALPELRLHHKAWLKRVASVGGDTDVGRAAKNVLSGLPSPQLAGGVAAPPPGEFPRPSTGFPAEHVKAIEKAAAEHIPTPREFRTAGAAAKAFTSGPIGLASVAQAKKASPSAWSRVRQAWKDAGAMGQEEVERRLRRSTPLPVGTAATPLQPSIPERVFQAALKTKRGGAAAQKWEQTKKFAALGIGKVLGEPRATKLRRAKNIKGELKYEDLQAARATMPAKAQEQMNSLVGLAQEMHAAYKTPEMLAAAYRIVNGTASTADNALIPPGLRAPLQGHQIKARQILTDLVTHGFMSSQMLDKSTDNYIRRFYPKHVAQMGAEGIKPLRRRLHEWLSPETGELRRRKLTEAQSKSYNVIEDIAYASFKGLGNELKVTMRGDMLNMFEKHGYAATPVEAPAGWRTLKGPRGKGARRAAYGRFGELMFHPEVAADIEFATGFQDPGWMGKGLVRGLVNQVKRNVVTRNLPTHAHQIVGNYAPGWMVPFTFADLMDIDLSRPSHLKKYLSPAVKMARAKSDPIWKEFQNTELPSSDFVSQFLDPLSRATKGTEVLDQLGRKYRTGVAGKAKAVDKWLADTYRMQDTFLKWMGYLKYRREGYNQPDAVSLVKRSTPNYQLVPDRIRALENSVVGAPFLLFKYDSSRVMLNHLFSVRGALKLAKWAAFRAAFVKAMQETGMQVDDEQLEAMRKSGHYSTLSTPLPFKTPQGGTYWWDNRHVSPWATGLEPVIAALTGRGADAYESIGETARETFVSPILLTAAMEAGSGQEGFTERNIYERDEALHRKVAKGAAHVIKSTLPGMLTYGARDIARAAAEKPKRGGRPLPGALQIIGRRALGVPVTAGVRPGEAKKILREREKRKKKAGEKSVIRGILGIREKQRR